MKNFNLYVDIIDFTDENTNYLYSDVINKDIDECKTSAEEMKRKTLDVYVGTLNRFLQISSVIIPEFIPQSLWDKNSIELDSKIVMSVLRSNWLNMLFALDNFNVFENEDSEYFLEFEHIAQIKKQQQQNFRGEEYYNNGQYLKDLKDSIIGYIKIEDFMEWRTRDDSVSNTDGMSTIFNFMPNIREKINNTSFVFIDETANNPQGQYDLFNNVSKLYSHLHYLFSYVWNRLKELRRSHIEKREYVESTNLSEYTMSDGENIIKTNKEEMLDVINFHIFIFSSLYNVVDYFLYNLSYLSNKAFDSAKLLQIELRNKKEGKTEMFDYNNDKLNDVMTKEEFEKMMGKSVDEIEKERREREKLENGEDEEDEW